MGYRQSINGKLSSQLKCNVGFSLVEVLVTVLIFAVLATAINTVLLVGESSWQVNSVQIELQQELRKAMDWMKDDLRQTGASAISDGPENPADGIWYTTITFKMADSLTWNSDTTQFVLGGTDSNQLQRIEGSVTKVIAQNIQSLRFRRLAAIPNILEVSLTARKDTTKGNTITASLDFKVQMRN